MQQQDHDEWENACYWIILKPPSRRCDPTICYHPYFNPLMGYQVRKEELYAYPNNLYLYGQQINQIDQYVQYFSIVSMKYVQRMWH